MVSFKTLPPHHMWLSKVWSSGPGGAGAAGHPLLSRETESAHKSRKTQPLVHVGALGSQRGWNSLRKERIFLNHFLRREITTQFLASSFQVISPNLWRFFRSSSEGFYKNEMALKSPVQVQSPSLNGWGVMRFSESLFGFQEVNRDKLNGLFLLRLLKKRVLPKNA